MSEQDGFDARLAAHFEQEHGQIPADAFAARTMEKVRSERRRKEVMRTAWRAATLVAVIAASPWLITSAERLNAAVELSLSWTTGFPGAWVLGALAAAVAVAMRMRSR